MSEVLIPALREYFDRPQHVAKQFRSNLGGAPRALRMSYTTPAAVTEVTST
jgi:hypothetical protein